ncbi:hypothetical protein KDW82_05815 [Burkholderia vietnamiensis]|uniref:hypothetical protein n=1 Tax=Burkholderia vietnamiensis TaxID=60552 RepID=UPI001B8F0E7D|nr:hypothetical protein [Burkholderia vietnamiensis]MBR8188576.1 hypothetical protein [Burkholderia vietnamiensis]
MTTDNEKGPLNQMESGQEKRSASEARALSEIVNGTPSENLCRRGSPAPKQASETTAQQPRTYTTQPAESVMGIALRQCGNEMEWRHILACNPEFARMLPHEYFPVGTVLNLPPHPAAASRFEQPEKSLAPEGGSEARGRWIQANCPTGDIIKSPSPSNNREFPTSMSESDCEHRIALAPSQLAAAPIPYDGLTEEFADEVARLANDAPGIREAIAGALESCKAIIAPKDGATPSPADERAAFERFARKQRFIKDVQRYEGEAYGHCDTENAWTVWQAACVYARAASANETGAEGANDARRMRTLCRLLDAMDDMGNGFPGEVHAAFQEGGERTRAALDAAALPEDGAPTQAAEPFGWAQPKGGNYFTRNESSAKRIGGLVPVYTAPQPPAQADAQDVPADDLVGFVYVLENPDRPHDPVTRFSRRPLGVRSLGAKIVSLTPVYSRPAQADARVGMTDEQRKNANTALNYLNGCGGFEPEVKLLRALLQGANHA